MTKPPLQKGQIWLPGGNPESEEGREIVDVGDEEVTYTLPNSGQRQTRKSATISRFALWILQQNAKEISVVLQQQLNSEPDILVED